MYKLVVFSTLLAAACAHIVAPAPVVAAPIAHPIVRTYASAPVVQTYAAAPAVQTYAVAPAVHTYSSPAVAISHQITKNVHYASQPVVTGYTSQILKPDLGSIATPLATVTKERVLAPARTVATITPQITQVEPELHVRKVPVDVPVAHPYISEVEVRQPAPIVAHSVVAAPAVAHSVVAAPAVAHSVLAAPAIHAYPSIYNTAVKNVW